MAGKGEKSKRRAGRQASVRAWTPRNLLAAIRVGSVEDNVEVLKRAGVLTRSGKLARKYMSPGNRVSRAETAE